MQTEKIHFFLQIWPQFWSGQQPNAGQNIQHSDIVVQICWFRSTIDIMVTGNSLNLSLSRTKVREANCQSFKVAENLNLN